MWTIPSNKFYVLPQSQAFKDISDFIATTGLVPFGSLSFINQEIVKLYDTEKHVENNLNGKDMTTLCICDFKIDPNLQNDQFSNDLTKLYKIDNGSECAVALIELLSKIKDPNSNFEYELNSFKDGKSILKTHGICKMPKIRGQIKNNKKEEAAWLEGRKAQAFESPRPSVENVNDVEDLDLYS